MFNGERIHRRTPLTEDDAGLGLGIGSSQIARFVSAGTERELILRREIDASRHDKMTRHWNRGPFMDKFAAELRGNRKILQPALLIIDIMGLHEINNSGHVAGDEAIKATGLFLAEVIGENGFVGRLGGDEFGVVVDLAKISIEELHARLKQRPDYMQNYFLRWADSSITNSQGIMEHFKAADPKDPLNIEQKRVRAHIGGDTVPKAEIKPEQVYIDREGGLYEVIKIMPDLTGRVRTGKVGRAVLLRALKTNSEATVTLADFTEKNTVQGKLVPNYALREAT